MQHMHIKWLLYLIVIIGSLSCGSEKYQEFRIYPSSKITRVSTDSGFISLFVEIPEKKYIYGNPKGPGIGKATTITVKHPSYFTFKPARFLTPKSYTAPGESKHVWIYENKTIIFLPFTIKEKTPEGPYTISITVDALICDTSLCIPKIIELDSIIHVLKKGTPVPVDENLQSQFSLSRPSAEIATPKTVPKDINSNMPIPSFQPRYLRAHSITNIVQAILFGILAGFILNFMPCVLPVVSLKIMGFIKLAGQNKREFLKHGFLFTSGIITSFLVLAILASSLGYNWGSLFQNRLFLITMIAIVFALTLSMFDIFTINIPSFASKVDVSSHQYLESFTKGLLATLLATPCSGPFLGGTLAWSLTQTPLIVFIIFMSIGIGMAIPYIILTVNPRLMKLIPKPGEWMITFERIMAFLLLATTVYLIGILDTELIMPTLWFLLIFSFGLWQYGRYGAIHQTKIKRVISIAILIILTFTGYIFSYSYLYKTSAQEKVDDLLFSMDELYQNRDAGKISIVKFTADWCPNCVFVESTSLYTEEVIDTVKKGDIYIYIADITRRNHEAEALLEKLGSHSIPFLAIFPPHSDFYRPICLRDIYSEGDVLHGIESARKAIPEVRIDSIRFE